jgi:glucose/arabinose dehydrogenase
MRHSSLCRIFLASLLLTICGCSKTSTPPQPATSMTNSPDANNSAANSANSTAPNGQSGAPAQPAPTSPPPPPPIVVPAGKVLTVTLDQTINSKIANNGDSFVASLAEPVTVDANVVLPIGTKVRGTIVTAQSAGKFKGNALLQLTLDSVSVNGTRCSIQTSEFEEAGKGRGKRTATGAGGGAVFGAIIGAVAGGGKGAAIGALAGGGAGTAAAGFTGKKDIVLPAETRLHFRLVQPVSIQPGS